MGRFSMVPTDPVYVDKVSFFYFRVNKPLKNRNQPCHSGKTVIQSYQMVPDGLDVSCNL